MPAIRAFTEMNLRRSICRRALNMSDTEWDLTMALCQSDRAITLSGLAETTGIPRGTLTPWIKGGVAMGYVEEVDGRFKWSATGREVAERIIRETFQIITSTRKGYSPETIKLVIDGQKLHKVRPADPEILASLEFYEKKYVKIWADKIW